MLHTTLTHSLLLSAYTSYLFIIDKYSLSELYFHFSDEEAIGLFEHALTVARAASTDRSLLEPLLHALKSVKTKSAYESSTSVSTENDGLEKERRAAKLKEREREVERAGKESVREEKNRYV